jgi:hypothetical protein
MAFQIHKRIPIMNRGRGDAVTVQEDQAPPLASAFIRALNNGGLAAHGPWQFEADGSRSALGASWGKRESACADEHLKVFVSE